MAEDVRVQVRKHHQASVKKGKYEKRSVELEEASPSWFATSVKGLSLFLVSEVVRQARRRGRQDRCTDEKSDWEQIGH